MQFLVPGVNSPDLGPWKDRPVHALAPRDLVPQPHHDLTEATLAVENEGEPVDGGPFERVEDSILRYRIFGPKIGTPITECNQVEMGETVGLVYRFLPILSLFFASRVVDIFRREETADGWRSGFIYRTLECHPELGEEIFEVTKLKTGAVSLRIEAWSRPNLWYVKLFTPWSRYIQKRAARCAVEYLTGVAHGWREVETDLPARL